MRLINGLYVLLLAIPASPVTAQIPPPRFPRKGLATGLPAGYTVTDLHWSIKPFPDRDLVVNTTGTVEQVMAEMTKVNPEFKRRVMDAAGAFNGDLAGARQEAGGTGTGVGAERWEKESYLCFGPWAGCAVDDVRDGWNYLLRVPGSPRLGPGPKVCGRVSCSWDAGIWWCNDHPTEWALNSFQDIAWPAYYIMTRCVDESGIYTAGQYFTTDKWNVIVSGGNENC